MRPDKNNDKSRAKLSPPRFSIAVSVFLIAEKLLSLLLKTFSLFLLNVSWKIKRNCMRVLFCIAHLLEVGKKVVF